MTPELDRITIALIYPLLFAIHASLALMAGLGHFPARARWQRLAIHALTGLGFAGIGLSTGSAPLLAKAVMSPIVRVIWVALIAVWLSVFVGNIRSEIAQRRQVCRPG